MQRLKYYSIVISIPTFLLCACLDAFSDKTEKIAGDIYFVNLEGSGQPFIGRKTGNNNFTPLICCNIKEVVGNKTSLLVKQTEAYPDTGYYIIYPQQSNNVVDTLTKEKYDELAASIEKSIHFIPSKRN